MRDVASNGASNSASTRARTTETGIEVGKSELLEFARRSVDAVRATRGGESDTSALVWSDLKRGVGALACAARAWLPASRRSRGRVWCAPAPWTRDRARHSSAPSAPSASAPWPPPQRGRLPPCLAGSAPPARSPLLSRVPGHSNGVTRICSCPVAEALRDTTPPGTRPGPSRHWLP